MKTYENKTILLILVLTFIILISAPNTYAQSANWKLDPQISFKLPAYGTIITFANYTYFDSFIWDSFPNASSIKFNNIEVAGDTQSLSSFGLGVKYANATINYVNTGGKAEIVLSAPSGTISVLTIYYPASYPATIGVTVGTSTQIIQSAQYFRDFSAWNLQPPPAVYLNETSNLLEIKVKHASPVTVDVYWYGIGSSSGGGGGGGGAGGSSGGGTPPPSGGTGAINQPTIPMPEIPTDLMSIGIGAIVVILILVFAYGKIEESKDINKLFKKRFSKPLQKIDMKKKKRRSLW